MTWQPGFSSPQKGQFVLHIDEGDTMILNCVVKVMISLEYDFYFEGPNWVHIRMCVA